MLKTDLKETSETIKQISPHARSTKDCRKKRFLRIVLACFLILLLLSSAVSCSSKLTASESVPDNETATQTVAETKVPAPVPPELEYRCAGDSLLSTYKNRSADDFLLACEHFEKEGYALYSSLEKSGISAKTYTKGSALAHLYYHPVNKELNLVQSQTASDTLPPAIPAQKSGSFPCTVTQLNQSPVEFNGMGYVIQLTDGSFIVYDGGYPESADELLSTLQSFSGGAKPVVRAWVMTHLHGDHTGAFKRLAARANATELFSLEYMIYSPVPSDHPVLQGEIDDPEGVLKALQKAVARFPEAKLVYAHTGMQFSFCNLSMEILYTPESLYKNLRAPDKFNNTSILSRLKGENGSVLFTGDIDELGARLSARLYGGDLASDMVQMAHHGLNGPYSFYETVGAHTLWYPCSASFYKLGSNQPMRSALESSAVTREVIVAGNGRATRPFPQG